MVIYFLLLLGSLSKVNGSIAVIDKGLFPLERNSVAIQLFADIENMNRDKSCRVRALTKKCCLTARPVDCDPIHVFCPSELIIKPKDRKTLVFIYPTVFQHDKIGFCEFSIHYKFPHRLLRRQSLNITFNTGIETLETKSKDVRKYIGEREVTRCASIDENSLSDCAPVDCSMKYTDEKPYYDKNLNKCVKAATCLGDPDKALADMAYLPDVNFCRDLSHPAEIQDIYAISNGLCIVTERPAADKLFARVNTNCSTISQNLALLWDMMTGKLCPLEKGLVIDYSGPCKTALLSILCYIVGLSSTIVACVCGIYMSGWIRRKLSDCDSLHDYYGNFKRKFSRSNGNEDTPYVPSPRNSSVRNCLLREVINRDIPLELRHSRIDVCDRIGREVRLNKRYRHSDVNGSFQSRVMSSDSSTSLLRGSDDEESCSCK